MGGGGLKPGSLVARSFTFPADSRFRGLALVGCDGARVMRGGGCVSFL
jgi:hypothetical protein